MSELETEKRKRELENYETRVAAKNQERARREKFDAFRKLEKEAKKDLFPAMREHYLDIICKDEEGKMYVKIPVYGHYNIVSYQNSLLVAIQALTDSEDWGQKSKAGEIAHLAELLKALLMYNEATCLDEVYGCGIYDSISDEND